MPKTKSRTLTFKDPIYGHRITVELGTTQNPGEYECGTIKLEEFHNTPFHIGVLVHEVTHAAFDLLKQSGLQPGNQSEEAYAYYIQYLTEKILTKLISK